MRRVSLLFLLLVSLTMQSQIDFKLYFANNVDEITSLRNIKGANDLATKPSSDVILFTEDGGYQKTPN